MHGRHGKTADNHGKGGRIGKREVYAAGNDNDHHGKGGIKKLLPAELEKGEKTRPVERFYYFLAFATILLWLWMLISEHPAKKRKHLSRAAALFKIAMLFGFQNPVNAQKPETLPKLPETAKVEKPEPLPNDPVEAYNQAREIQLKKKKGDSSKLYETAINLADKNPAVRTNSFNNLGVKQHQKARQTAAQAIGQVKQQNLDGAISQLEGAKKILDLAEEMYIKALSTEIPEKSDEEKIASQKSAKDQSAINQQLLLNDRAAIDELIKKIKELKKQQEKAQKQTQKAQKQQQKKNQQKKQKQKQEQKQQDKKKQDKNKQKQDKKQDKQKQDKKQQQNKKQQDKNKQKQDKQQKQQQKPDDELKKAQDDVKKLEKQAKDLGQKKMEKQAKKAKEELDKAEKARKKEQGKKAEDHIKKALEQLNPKASDKDKKKKDNKGKGKNNKDNKDKQKNKDKKKDKGKDGKDKKDKELPKPQPQQAKQAKAQKAPKDIDPKEARKLLKLMTEKEKDFRKALKAHRQQQYKNIKVEKDW